MNNSPSPPPPASDGTTGVYSITVAAELSGMSVQGLRLYNAKDSCTPTAPPAAPAATATPTSSGCAASTSSSTTAST
ncbi:MAG TPA: hypothetical protein VIC62_00085 [Nakamurella sp.]